MSQDRSLQEMRRQNAVVLYGLAGHSVSGVDGIELDDIAVTLRDFLRADYAAVHVLDDDQQITLASSIDPDPAPVPREDSVCSVVLDEYDGADVIEIPDARDHPDLRDNPYVDGERAEVRFYAATPLRTPSGLALGTLCAVGHHPRTLTAAERQLLLHLGYAVVHVLERRRRQRRPDAGAAG